MSVTAKALGLRELWEGDLKALHDITEAIDRARVGRPGDVTLKGDDWVFVSELIKRCWRHRHHWRS